MMNAFSSIVTVMLIWCTGLLGQPDSNYVRIDADGRQAVPKCLLNTISVNLDHVPFEYALAIISEKGDFKLSYSRSRIPSQKKVTIAMQNVHALEALIYVMEKTNTKLLVTRSGELAIVPSMQTTTRTGCIRGRVLDS